MKKEVVLVNMPHKFVCNPSLALGVLQAGLERRGIGCYSHHANLRFVEQIGLDTNGMLMQVATDFLVGEWIFSGAAFGEFGGGGLEKIFRDPCKAAPKINRESTVEEEGYLEVFRRLRAFAPSFVRETAEKVLSFAPKIVGCTSTFEQHAASLALLREIKRVAPGVTTVLGGANCEASAGWVTAKNCPWVDFVFSGEADGLFEEFCEKVLGGEELGGLPPSVISQAAVAEGRFFPGEKVPRASLASLRGLPPPDFGDYFRELEISPMKKWIAPALAVETSRGCWWGEKSHCTFCGLNGEGMAYRRKEVAQVVEEWRVLHARHGVKKFAVVDNIIAMDHVKNFLPLLRDAGAPYLLFYETKANLRREQIRLFAQAGVTNIQPGIEALHDGLLKLMAKGTTAATNVQLLKYTREVGIFTVWLLLTGFPGEELGWHEEVAEKLPALFHLQPPMGAIHVRFVRQSIYHEEQERFGLDLRPLPAYAEVYPFPEEDLKDFALYFYDANGRRAEGNPPEIEALGRQVSLWRRAAALPVRPVLCVEEKDGELEFFDTRGCAFERRAKYGGVAKEIYELCDRGTTRAALEKRFCFGEAARLRGEELEKILEEFFQRKFVLDFGGALVGVACYGAVPSLPTQENNPHGGILRYDPDRNKNLFESLKRLRENPPEFPNA